MKNYVSIHFHYLLFQSRIIKIMKLTTLLLFTSLLTISASIFSQSSEIRLKYQGAKVIDILSEIEHQSNYRFLYQNEQINVNRQASVNIKEKDLRKILDMLFLGKTVSYKSLMITSSFC